MARKSGARKRWRVSYSAGPIAGYRNPRRVKVRKGRRRGAFSRSLAELRRLF